MESVDKINAQHGESPQQHLIQSQGDAYLTKEFPKLDYVRKATIAKGPPPPPPRRSSVRLQPDPVRSA